MHALREMTAEPSTTGMRPAARTHGVVVWAVIGLAWVALCVKVLISWVTGPDFGPAPIVGPDVMATGKIVALRVLEVLSVLVLLASAWRMAWVPWRRDRVIRIEALLIVGGVLGFVADSFLNVYDFLFAFNAHSVNLGAWNGSLPFHRTHAPTGYGEALLWGLPMYIYFCCALGAMGLAVRKRARARWPRVSDTVLVTGMWVFFLAFDFVVENAIIRLTDAYSFVRTQGGLTLWAGSQYQFPIYESICVAFVATAFAAIRMSADADEGGASFIERGLIDLPGRTRLAVRTLAAVGYSAVVLIICYHLPFNWLSVGGASLAHLPSYLKPG
ncbi:MAG: hypothetical protein JWR52_2209 [Marmoricola sp.]|nr:hypothetical protein [Marmoricola sp.]